MRIALNIIGIGLDILLIVLLLKIRKQEGK